MPTPVSLTPLTDPTVCPAACVRLVRLSACPAACVDWSTCLPHVVDSNIRVKYVAERAMLYALEVHSRPDTLNEFVAKAPVDAAR